VGTLSVYDALRTFSIRSMVAAPAAARGFLEGLGGESTFLAPPGT
jgi:hypothetical protein